MFDEWKGLKGREPPQEKQKKSLRLLRATSREEIPLMNAVLPQKLMGP